MKDRGEGKHPDRALVSVIIPSRNRPQQVNRAVRSVLEQGNNVEILVVDDGSAPQLLPEGPLGSDQVDLVRNESSLGPAKARNIGLRASTGEFVSFLDDDDYWLPGKLDCCLDAARTFPDAKVIVHKTGFRPPPNTQAPPVMSLVTSPLGLYGTSQTPHVDGLFLEGDLAREIEFDEEFDAAQDVDFVLRLARRTPFVLIDAVFSLHGLDETPSDVTLDRRIAARNLLRERHSDILYSSARSRSFFHLRMGHLHRRRKKRGESMSSFLRSLRHNPLNSQAWRGVGAVVLPPDLVRAVSLKRRTNRG